MKDADLIANMLFDDLFHCDTPLAAKTYAEGVARDLNSDTLLRIDYCTNCVDQSTWHCLASLHLDSFFYIFCVGMGILSFAAFIFVYIPAMIWIYYGSTDPG